MTPLLACNAPSAPVEAPMEESAARLQPYRAPVENGRFSPELLWSLGRIGEYAVSPDGERVAYTVTRYDMAANRGWSEIYLVPARGGESVQLTDFQAQCFNLAWSPDGARLLFVSTRGEQAQVYGMLPDGSNLTQLSQVAGGVEGFLLSPDGTRILYTARVRMLEGVRDRYPDLGKATARIYDDLMYRHWDSWDEGERSHIFVAPLLSGIVGEAIDLLRDELYDSPLRPFGGMEEIAWSPDGKEIAYTCKKLTGRDAALSTNSDIYIYDLATGQTRNISAPNPGYDRCPSYSPDGKYISWLSMARPGFEADRERIMLLDRARGESRELAPRFDYSPIDLHWREDASGLLFTAGVRGTKQIYTLPLNGEEPTAITSGVHDYTAVARAHGGLVATRVSMTSPAELYFVDETTRQADRITNVNTDLLAELQMPEVTQRMVTTTDGKQMLVWVLLPPGFDSTRAYPAILYCQGGPQSHMSQFWSYRWNPALMASQGYVVIAPGRRGVLGFGQEWTDAISKDHGGQEMRDLLAAYDHVVAEPWVDAKRVAAVGASYGGYTVNWLAGHNEGRFRSLISHCGVFHSEMEFYTTEELFFDIWEMGGEPWDRRNAVAQRSFAQSAHQFVENWDTPILVIHGGRDFRIPYTQGMAAFNAARMRGIKSRFLFFPDESHWVLKPQNGLLWQREFYRWLEETMR